MKALSLLCALCLAGCSTVSKPLIQKEVEFIPVSIPSHLLQPIDPSPPPDKEEFIKMSKEYQVQALVELSQSLYIDLGKYRMRLETIREVNEKQKESIHDKVQE